MTWVIWLPAIFIHWLLCEFYFWFQKNAILLLLSYYVDRSLFGGGQSKEKVAFSSAVELFVLVYDILRSLHRSPRRRTASRSRSRYDNLPAILVLVTRRSPQINIKPTFMTTQRILYWICLMGCSGFCRSLSRDRRRERSLSRDRNHKPSRSLSASRRYWCSFSLLRSLLWCCYFIWLVAEQPPHWDILRRWLCYCCTVDNASACTHE